MDAVIVTSESQLAELIDRVVGRHFKTEPQKVEPDNLSGTKDAVLFLKENGFELSESLFTKQTAKGLIPCKRFHNKRLLFSKKELILWAQSKCEPVGQSDTALKLAESASRKLRGGRK